MLGLAVLSLTKNANTQVGCGAMKDATLHYRWLHTHNEECKKPSKE
jgi:hypothetical protein